MAHVGSTLPECSIPEDGVPDMTRLSQLNEDTVNRNLKVRYGKDRIYVSFLFLIL
ncbi:myosin-2 heavy chain-like [Agrilus planipennis]|uniref:Myosin-2 heavy chain-like n=1 Tax=Agrilus planipennis TaxID=224129 RepID=A0A7F5R3Q1_AGRPL|nr:myosin-2 heavy chain-like [Agrilus planipennis]